MRRGIVALLIGLVAGAAEFVAVAVATGQEPPPGPPAVTDPAVPGMPMDLGTGERLLLVVGGTYATRAEAEAAGAGMSFGDLQGYYVVPTGQFGGMAPQLPVGGRFALVSAFRTRAGARAFAELARAAGAPAAITERVLGTGGEYAGLGQEPAPDGSGPLDHPVPASMPEGTGA